jgi:serine phosphatase RsbU (regulator of sigma subunit)
VSTARLVSNLNQHLYASTAPEKYATFFFSLYDDETGRLSYTNAGHLAPLLIRRGEALPLDVNGTVVGAFPDVPTTRATSWSPATCWSATPTASPSPRTNTARCSASNG